MSRLFAARAGNKIIRGKDRFAGLQLMCGFRRPALDELSRPFLPRQFSVSGFAGDSVSALGLAFTGIGRKSDVHARRPPGSWISIRFPNGSRTKKRRHGAGRPSSVGTPAASSCLRRASTFSDSKPKCR